MSPRIKNRSGSKVWDGPRWRLGPEDSPPGWSAGVCSEWSCEQGPHEAHDTAPLLLHSGQPLHSRTLDRSRKTSQIWNLCLSGLLRNDHYLDFPILILYPPSGNPWLHWRLCDPVYASVKPFPEPKAPQHAVLKPVPSLLYPTYLLLQVIWNVQTGSSDQDGEGWNSPQLESTQVATLRLRQVATVDLA